ncbi:hypothetical protein BDB00DRAFT_874884 [Zychaea mexicana]|uniref:uncharacterized protein n=1 Tax=Zychaea mexicana TaxID=64656 RepID=UPI0022FECF1B|nr:uncharacterized protein BDB00DRAFT_874884 [Zychaea mexicana]KAI9490882.1 hypothetical protein BDB00DRAFT_874884 [Zychaea mexicana]
MSGGPSKQGRLPPGSSKEAGAVGFSVIIKLIFFTLCMFVLPIATYYYSVDGLFEGNGTYAAGAAAGMANLVALCYIVAAVLEDKDKDKDKQD